MSQHRLTVSMISLKRDSGRGGQSPPFGSRNHRMLSSCPHLAVMLPTRMMVLSGRTARTSPVSWLNTTSSRVCISGSTTSSQLRSPKDVSLDVSPPLAK